jgi:hypothetical protein
MFKYSSLAGVLFIGAAGCEASITTHEQPTVRYAYVEVDGVPSDIDGAPTTQYEGRTIYLYKAEWYFRDGQRWRKYGSEPSELVERRHHLSHEEKDHSEHHDKDQEHHDDKEHSEHHDDKEHSEHHGR